uniref:Uncharacterized protein n=1 Tax=Arundo donax TaxID=35708 RepID=A0A0A8Z0B1_ARUDO
MLNSCPVVQISSVCFHHFHHLRGSIVT